MIAEYYPSCEISFIYGLVDPNDNIVRYIGQTVEPKRRLRDHKNCLKKGNGLYKMNWIKKLKSENKSPELLIIECCDRNKVNERENHYIKIFFDLVKTLGKNLTNSDFGLNSISEATVSGQKKASLKVNDSIGVKKKKELWEVYISINNQRYYCGNFRNKRVAQKIYDGVSRNYLKEPVTNFQGEFKFTIDKAREISNKFSRRRNGYTLYSGIYKQADNKWDVNVKLNNEWVRLGRTNDLNLAVTIRDKVLSGELTTEQANQLLTQKKQKYKGVRETPHGYQISIFTEGKNQNIGFTKNINKAVYYYDCVANYLNKKSNNTTQDKLSLEEAKLKVQ